VARNGRARTAWVESANNKATVWTSYYDGMVWSDATMALAAENPYDRIPKVVMDAAGNGALMWVQPDMNATPADSIWVATFTGAPLSTPRLLDTSANAIYYPAVAGNPDGQLMVAWVQRIASDNEELWAIRGTTQGTWQTAERVARGTSMAVPAVTIDRQSTGTVTWVHYAGGRYNLHASRGRPGEAWSSPTPLEADNTAKGDYREFPDPEMSVDASGSVAVVWRKKIVGNTYGIYLRQLVGTDWQPEVRLGQVAGLNGLGHRVVLNDTGAGAATFWFGDPDGTKDPERWMTYVALRY
jgi:hypothetical protein